MCYGQNPYAVAVPANRLLFSVSANALDELFGSAFFLLSISLGEIKCVMILNKTPQLLGSPQSSLCAGSCPVHFIECSIRL